MSCSNSGQTKQFFINCKSQELSSEGFFFTMIKILAQNLIFLEPIPSNSPFLREIHEKPGWKLPECQPSHTVLSVDEPRWKGKQGTMGKCPPVRSSWPFSVGRGICHKWAIWNASLQNPSQKDFLYVQVDELRRFLSVSISETSLTSRLSLTMMVMIMMIT